jgi:hypothetical protein
MRTVILILVLLIAGCNREKSFDERFADTEKSIREKAKEMDAEMAEQERLASEAAAAASTEAPGGPQKH